MKRDLIVEIICKALAEDYFEESRIKTVTLHPPTDTVQKMTITDFDGHKLTIEIEDLGITH